MAPTPDALGLRHRSVRLARRLRQALNRLPQQEAESSQPGLTVAEMFELHGPASLGGAVLFWALFSQLPVGGVGNVAALALWVLALDWGLGRNHPRCPRRLLGWRLGLRGSRRLLGLLASGYRRAGRWLRPRWAWLREGAALRIWWACWIAFQAGLIFLPLPLGNLLPGLSLGALGLGQLAQDGAMHALSLLLGLVAVAYVLWLGDWAWAALQWLAAGV